MPLYICLYYLLPFLWSFNPFFFLQHFFTPFLRHSPSSSFNSSHPRAASSPLIPTSVLFQFSCFTPSLTLLFHDTLISPAWLFPFIPPFVPSSPLPSSYLRHSPPLYFMTCFSSLLPTPPPLFLTLGSSCPLVLSPNYLVSPSIFSFHPFLPFSPLPSCPTFFVSLFPFPLLLLLGCPSYIFFV